MTATPHTDPDCLFCHIAGGEVPADLVHRSDELIAFNDTNPKAPTHILICPTEHIATLNDMEPRHAGTVGRMFLLAADIAREQGFADQGYRTVFNCNRLAGQSVFHIHLHLLAGRLMGWPPG